MDVTLVSGCISGFCVIVGSCITAFWGSKTKDDPSPKAGKKAALGIIIAALALLTVFISNQYLIHKIPSIDELNELQASITELQATLAEKNQEVETLTGENEELSSTNEELKKENDELNEKLNPDVASLSSMLIKNERYFEVSESPVKDTLGNTYKGGSMLIWASGDDEYGKADFRLDNQYSTLSNVTVAISSDAGGSEHADHEGWVSIYAKVGDEWKELATSPALNNMSDSYIFEDINITGVEWLEIRFSNADFYWSSLKAIIANAELS